MTNSNTQEIMSTFINEHSFAVLSTINSKGHPHGTAIYAGCDKDLNVYFKTKSGTAKSSYVDNDDMVALTFGDEAAQATLQLSGSVAEVYDPAEGDAAMQLLDNLKHHTDDARQPLSKLNAGSYIIFRITPDWAHMTVYGGGSLAGGVQTYDYNRE